MSDFALPPQPCAGDCGRAIDPLSRDTHFEILGWIQRRPPHSGGVHHVELKTETRRVMCDECMRKLRNGLATGQEPLL